MSSNLISTRQGAHAVEVNTDILAVIGEGTHNHHPKEIIVLGYDTK
jgi:hypothetical protein